MLFRSRKEVDPAQIAVKEATNEQEKAKAMSEVSKWAGKFRIVSASGLEWDQQGCALMRRLPAGCPELASGLNGASIALQTYSAWIAKDTRLLLCS